MRPGFVFEKDAGAKRGNRWQNVREMSLPNPVARVPRDERRARDDAALLKVASVLVPPNDVRGQNGPQYNPEQKSQVQQCHIRPSPFVFPKVVQPAYLKNVFLSSQKPRNSCNFRENFV